MCVESEHEDLIFARVVHRFKRDQKKTKELHRRTGVGFPVARRANSRGSICVPQREDPETHLIQGILGEENSGQRSLLLVPRAVKIPVRRNYLSLPFGLEVISSSRRCVRE